MEDDSEGYCLEYKERQERTGRAAYQHILYNVIWKHINDKPLEWLNEHVSYWKKYGMIVLQMAVERGDDQLVLALLRAAKLDLDEICYDDLNRETDILGICLDILERCPLRNTPIICEALLQAGATIYADTHLMQLKLIIHDHFTPPTSHYKQEFIDSVRVLYGMMESIYNQRYNTIKHELSLIACLLPELQNLIHIHLFSF